MSRVNVQKAPDTMKTKITLLDGSVKTFGEMSAKELGIEVLYIDLNSCFASVEQQARPKLRGKPVAITNRLVEHSHIVAVSYEAKSKGVKVGMRIEEAQQLCPNIIVAETEPDKYIYVHMKLKNIMKDYSPVVIMKSIDEGLIDISEAPIDIQNRPLIEIAMELKERIRSEIGSYMRCNVGFGENRFYAKLAGELHKPDGCDVIMSGNNPLGVQNNNEIFKHLKLTDLPGVNVRMEARMNTYNIFTPVDLLNASAETLHKQVCHSVDGLKWYDRLRGKEVDIRGDETKSVGRQFVLPPEISDENIRVYLAHLCEDVGARMRSQELYAKGIMVWRRANGVKDKVNEYDLTYNPELKETVKAGGLLKVSQISRQAFNSDQDIMRLALKLFEKLPKQGRIIGVTLYKLQPAPDDQKSLFQDKIDHQEKIAKLTDKINNRFGTRTIHSAYTTNTENITNKIPFGSTKYLGK